MKTRQMTPFYLLFQLYLFAALIFVFENSQSSFSCSPLAVDTGLQNMNFWMKATDSDDPLLFSRKTPC